ncbi:MAG: hypothetical protein MJ208_04395 [Bacilli bacterium]|nr:hypothetical protein [Bacilli bacterium]
MPSSLITPILRDKKKYCLICFNEMKINNFHTLFHKDINICEKCFSLLGPIRKSVKVDGVKGEYLFTYSDLMKEKIYTLKGCGDIELAKAFLNYFKDELISRYRGYLIIPAPSETSSDQERGFNHVMEIFRVLNLSFLPLIKKKVNYKQSDLSKEERAQVINKLSISNLEKIHAKKILFVDDISTSGATLKACLSLIKKGQPKKLHFVIVAKVIDTHK